MRGNFNSPRHGLAGVVKNKFRLQEAEPGMVGILFSSRTLVAKALKVVIMRDMFILFGVTSSQKVQKINFLIKNDYLYAYGRKILII